MSKTKPTTSQLPRRSIDAELDERLLAGDSRTRVGSIKLLRDGRLVLERRLTPNEIGDDTFEQLKRDLVGVVALDESEVLLLTEALEESQPLSRREPRRVRLEAKLKVLADDYAAVGARRREVLDTVTDEELAGVLERRRR